MAAGQWFFASWSSSASAFVPRLLQIDIPSPYGDWQHLDAFAWLHCFYWRGTVLRISANCWNTVSRENRIRSILYGRYHLFRILVRFPHFKLSFCGDRKTVLKVSVCENHLNMYTYILYTLSRSILRLDYCGIALLIMGSFVPWLYYGFYCHYQPKVIYLSVVCVLGCLSIIVSLWDKFSEPGLRPLRAGVFMSFGLSGVIPAVHYSIMEGWFSQISRASLGWLILMGELNMQQPFLSRVLNTFTFILGLLYILGALLYALRVPERWFPGKFDIWVNIRTYYSRS